MIHYANGTRFKGTFKNGQRHGKAIEETKEGIRFEGSYLQDRRDGKFVEKDRNGSIIKQGHYDSGRRYEN